MVDIEKLFARASEAFQQNKYDYAITMFVDILKLDPNHVKSHQILRVASIRKCEEKGYQGKLSATLQQAKIQAQCGVTKDADSRLKLCQDFLINNPHNETIRLAMARAYRDKGAMEGSIAEFEIVFNANGSSVAAAKALGELYADKKDFKKAQDYFQIVMKIAPEDREVGGRLKDILARQTIQETGIEDAKSTQDLIKDKDKAKELSQAQKLVKTEDELDQEIAKLREQVDASPGNVGNVKFLKKIGEIYVKKKAYDEAIGAYEEALELDKMDGQLRMKVGDIKVQKFDTAIAAAQGEGNQDEVRNLKVAKLKFQIEDFQNRVKEHPTDMQVRFHLGTYYFTGKLFDKAINEFQLTVRDPKRKVESMTWLGRCFVHKEMYVVAISQFTKALDGGNVSTEQAKDIRYFLADAYGKAGEPAKGVAEYDKIMEEDINYKDVSARRAEMAKEVKK